MHEINGSNLHTASILWPSNPFYPTSQDWDSVTIDLSSYDGQNDVSIAFCGIFGGGNNLYIDDVDIREGSSTTSTYNINDIIDIYPNPTKDILYLNHKFPLVKVYNMLGELSLMKKYENKIDVSELENGVYLIEITINNGNVISDRIVINR